LVKEYNHVQTPLGLAEKGQYAFLLIISVAGTIGSGIFVLKPSYIPRVAKWNNSIFPMYKEPFEPSDLYIGLHLLGSVIGFLAFLILSIILIAALF
jgi:hypothetical protein